MIFNVIEKVALAVLIATGTAQSAVIATTTFGTSTYHLLDRGTWHAKEAEAVSLGGHLVTISSAAENQFVLNFWQPYADIWGLWIGLNDLATDGAFSWTSGQALTYTNWPQWEPNGGTSENAVHMHPDGFWNDNSDSVAFQALAEVSQAVPEPGTGMLLGIAVAALAGARGWKSRLAEKANL